MGDARESSSIPAPDSKTETGPRYPRSTDLRLEDRHIDQGRELHVAVIGAGLSGVLAGVLLPAKVPRIKLTIFEKNADVGGTWFENVYPGVRCDIPAHVYQATFAPNTKWTEEFAQGPEILAYWKDMASKYDVYKYIKLRHKVEDLEWKPESSKWTVTVRELATDVVHKNQFDVVITAIGRFNAWRLPDYPGMSEYKGLLRHTSNWDPSFDPTGKKIAVIGNGASGIQLVANVQPRVARLDHYARNPTWIATSFAGDDAAITPKVIPDALRQSFDDDPDIYLRYRKSVEAKYWRGIENLKKGSKGVAENRDKFVRILRERTTAKPELADRLVPDFSPHCRRLTPGPGYFEAISSENVDYVQTRIRRFTETGIETEDGVHREVDAVFCATGANTDLVPPFPIRAHGKDLTQVWSPDDDGEYGFPYSYLGIATPGFPNFFYLLGPYGIGRSGTVPYGVEAQLGLLGRILRKLSREGLRSIVPSRKAANEFVDYADAYFSRTVLSENCSSWFNGGRPGGRVHGIWPGSTTHMTIVFRNPRWEDWEYEYVSSPGGNRLLWYFGNGFTAKEADEGSDMTSYLKNHTEVDLRDVHESWWSVP